MSLRAEIEAAKSADDARARASRYLKKQGTVVLSGRVHSYQSGLDRATVAVIATAWWLEQHPSKPAGVERQRP